MTTQSVLTGLRRVTLTGADDSVQPRDLLDLSRDYPFVEWGILFSPRQQGNARVPTLEWVRRLADLIPDKNGLHFSAHLCGRYVRDFVLKGNFTWIAHPEIPTGLFDRVQLNFHGEFHRMCAAFESKVEHLKDLDFILQCDGVNDRVARDLCLRYPNCAPLFDTSGGAGVLPDRWPKAWQGIYCGYAGGLGPDNVVEQLEQITPLTPDQPFWIDMERRVRSDDDSKFELNKVAEVLEACAPYVRP